MPADPEHHWQPEPTEQFAYPHDHQVDLLKDYFRQVYGRGLTGPEIEWLGGVVSDFLAWSQNNCSKREARTAALKMIRLLSAIDQAMVDSKNPSRTWGEISISLGLPSVCFSHLTEAELATSHGVTKMAVSKKVTRFLRIVELEPHRHGYNGMNPTF